VIFFAVASARCGATPGSGGAEAWLITFRAPGGGRWRFIRADFAAATQDVLYGMGVGHGGLLAPFAARFVA
jgi:hypothetical protein